MKCYEELKELEEDQFVNDPLVDALTLEELQFGQITLKVGASRENLELRKHKLFQIANLEETIDVIKRQLRLRQRRILTESHLHAMSEGPADAENKDSIENVLDIMGNPPAEKTAGVMAPIQGGASEPLSIQEFLKRPVQIATFSWSSGIIDQQLRVWDLWSLTPSVRAKLRNFTYFKGDLHVKIACAGTPFHMGKVMVSYQPYDFVNRTLRSYRSAAVFTADLYYNFLNYLSQAPGAFMMDVKDNMPVVLKCPFISTKPLFRLWNQSALALGAATSYADFYDAGCMFIEGVTAIASVAPALIPVQFYVYAWMENVELGPPTGSISAITTEGRRHERETGPVEKVAMRAAAAADALAVVPEIGPYAVASSMVLRGLGNLAGLFGFSKPIVDMRPQSVKNWGFQNTAQGIGYDTAMKISLDPKQELTVDPRVCGSTTDDLSLALINSVETYITQFQWSQSAPVMQSPIWVCGVSPYIGSTAIHTAVTYTQPSAMMFAAQPFEFWRGDITYTFDIVCSAFHRGKLAFFYEPNNAQAVLINATISPNKQFLKVIDLEETQKVSFTVKWAGPRQWLIMSDDPAPYGNVVPTTVDRYNGYIAVVPMTKLTCTDSSAVTLVVSAHSNNMHYNYLTKASLPIARRIVTASRSLGVLDDQVISLNESTASCNTITQDHFGEEPLSFRTCLKRFAGLGNASVTSGGTNTNCIITGPVLPINVLGYSTAPSATLTTRNLFDYLRFAYLGARGSVRYRTQIRTTLTVDQNQWVRVYLENIGIYSNSFNTNAVTTNPMTDLNGTNVFITYSNGGIEFEVPYYSNNLFAFAFSHTWDDDSVFTDTGSYETNYISAWSVSIATDQSKTLSVNHDVATGEDFTFMRFQGAPYYSSS